jgi:hypothetical protein
MARYTSDSYPNTSSDDDRNDRDRRRDIPAHGGAARRGDETRGEPPGFARRVPSRGDWGPFEGPHDDERGDAASRQLPREPRYLDGDLLHA